LKTKLIMVGAKGRMGQAILRLAKADASFEVVGEVDQGDDLAVLMPKCDVLIDFSHHSTTLAVAELAAQYGKALAIGTTGHSDDVKKQILAFGSKIPVIFASNYSVGVNTLFYLTQKAAAILALRGYDMEVVEMHHHHKKDAPSGTAKTLVEILAKELDQPLLQHGREGEVGARRPNEIGIHALRGGDVVGDHTVMFATDGERVELTHKASSRDTFASGALAAARFLTSQKPGIYEMVDVLDLK
jgi:4-hydroxy-tetrahydrodipicolinate reductase